MTGSNLNFHACLKTHICIFYVFSGCGITHFPGNTQILNIHPQFFLTKVFRQIVLVHWAITSFVPLGFLWYNGKYVFLSYVFYCYIYITLRIRS